MTQGAAVTGHDWKAIFLVAGDKSGNWAGWYREAIPLADARFTEHLIALKEEQEG